MTGSPDGISDGVAVDVGPYVQRYLAGDRNALVTLTKLERELAQTLAQDSEDVDPDPESSTRLEELDPIALALGLVPGPRDVLGSQEFQSARMRARLDLRQFLELLQQRGWDVSGHQILAWHKTNTIVSPALMTAIADTLGVPVASLRGVRAAQPVSDVAATDYLDDVVIDSYLREWAAEIGQDLTHLRRRTRQTLVSLNFRNRQKISRDDVLGILRAIRSIDPAGGES